MPLLRSWSGRAYDLKAVLPDMREGVLCYSLQCMLTSARSCFFKVRRAGVASNMHDTSLAAFHQAIEENCY